MLVGAKEIEGLRKRRQGAAERTTYDALPPKLSNFAWAVRVEADEKHGRHHPTKSQSRGVYVWRLRQESKDCRKFRPHRSYRAPNSVSDFVVGC